MSHNSHTPKKHGGNFRSNFPTGGVAWGPCVYIYVVHHLCFVVVVFQWQTTQETADADLRDRLKNEAMAEFQQMREKHQGELDTQGYVF